MKNMILAPIKIGNNVCKNRIIYLAMAKYLSDDDLFVTEKQIFYYEQLAAGGVGLIVPGAMIIDEEWPSRLNNQPGLFDEKFIPGLLKLVKAVHNYDALIYFQLWHPGFTSYGKTMEKNGVAELSIDEIRNLQKKFQKAAMIAQKAGADGVEVQVCHTYLCNQFLSPKFNKRKDIYSAESVENGIRFTVEIIQQIQEACGKDFSVIVKLNGDDCCEGGVTPEIAAEAAVYLEKAGVDLITVSAGGKNTTSLGMAADGYKQEGWKVPLAEKVKEKVSLPVCATGSIRHPDYMNQLLEDKKCDMIGMGRGLLADSAIVKKVSEERQEEIRPCVSCMHCFNKVKPGMPRCSVNPMVLRNRQILDLEHNGEGRVVCVVGAGPAGMETAITLAVRGYKPVVYEESGQIGGMVRLAAVPDGKWKLNWMIRYYERMASKYQITLRLNTKATRKIIEEIHPYAVVLATGSVPIIPSIEGADKAHVFQVREILEEFPNVTGNHVLVVGAGMTGMETATTFAHKGNKVTVIDMLPEPETGEISREMTFVRTHAQEAGVKVKMSRQLLQILDDKVLVKDTMAGKTEELKADMVVLSLGVKKNEELYSNLKGEFERVFCIGDAKQVGKISDAVMDGYDCARNL